MLSRLQQHWLVVVDWTTEGDVAVYWDLLTSLWRHDRPMRKSEALQAMTSIKSLATARKYLRSVQQQGWVDEVDHPTDARSRWVMLSLDARARLDAFFDVAIRELVQTHRLICHAAQTPPR
jgi:hypothetical protein